jgi:uncharacterized protein
VTAGPVMFMEQMVDLDYVQRTPPVAQRFDEQMQAGRIIGHKCPSCGLVYVPPKGFCPMCVVETTEKDEVDVSDKGTVASFTILTPIQYRGQQEREPYAQASLLLDGADSTVGGQRVADIPLDQIRTGMRVKAVWRPEGERAATESGPRWGLGNAIEHWVPSGEPDAPKETFAEHVL